MMKKKALIALILACAAALAGCTAKTYEKTNVSKYVTLGEYKGITYKPISTEVTDYDLTCAVQKALSDSGYATVSEDQLNEGTVQIGDTCNIDFAGYKDGAAFEGGTAENYTLTIGSGSFIDGFEEGLVGVEVGKTVDLNLTFPEDYSNEALQGADVVFTVTVNYIKSRKSFPALTDELANTLDSSVQSAEDYLSNKRSELQASNESSAQSTIKSRVWNQAISNAAFAEKLPSTLLESAQQEFTNYYTAYAAQAGYTTLTEWLTANSLTEAVFNQKAEEYGESMVKSQLTAYAIAKAENYRVTDEILNEKAAAYATQSGYTNASDYIAKIGEDAVKDQIVLDYAVDLVVEAAVAQA